MAEELIPTRLLWDAKYHAETDRDVRDSWRRVAHALAAVEPRDPERCEVLTALLPRPSLA